MEKIIPSYEADVNYGELVEILQDGIDSEPPATPFTLVKNGIIIKL